MHVDDTDQSQIPSWRFPGAPSLITTQKSEQQHDCEFDVIVTGYIKMDIIVLLRIEAAYCISSIDDSLNDDRLYLFRNMCHRIQISQTLRDVRTKQ